MRSYAFLVSASNDEIKFVFAVPVTGGFSLNKNSLKVFILASLRMKNCCVETRLVKNYAMHFFLFTGVSLIVTLAICLAVNQQMFAIVILNGPHNSVYNTELYVIQYISVDIY